jgi:hypothetical protein
MTEPDTPDTPARPPLRRSPDRWLVRRPAHWLLLGLGLALLIGVGILLLFTQTPWGRGQVLAATVETIGGRINGQLIVQRMEGNLITGAQLYGLELRDPDGEPLLVAERAYLRYRLATLLGGDVVINRLDLFDADIHVFRMPDDTLWNYQRILTDTIAPEEPPGANLVERMRLHNVDVTIRQPWEPDPRLPAGAREQELREALEPGSRLMVEQVPAGYLRTTLIEIADAGITDLFLGPDVRGGLSFGVVDAVADVRLWFDPPLEIRDLVAQLHLQEGVVTYRASEIALPASRGSSVGTIDLRQDVPLYDVVVESPSFALADIRFLYPWLPEAGGGSTWLRLEDRPDGLLVLARDLELLLPNTHIAGTFGLIVDFGTLRFVEVDLEADPLEVTEVEQLFPGDLPVEGLVIGGAVIRGS